MWIQSMDLPPPPPPEKKKEEKGKKPTRTKLNKQNLVLANHGKLVR